jgi:hypothetical protein
MYKVMNLLREERRERERERERGAPITYPHFESLNPLNCPLQNPKP